MPYRSHGLGLAFGLRRHATAAVHRAAWFTSGRSCADCRA